MASGSPGGAGVQLQPPARQVHSYEEAMECLADFFLSELAAREHQPIAHQQRSMLAGPEQKVRSLFTEGVNYALAKASRPNVRFQVVQVKCVLLPNPSVTVVIVAAE